MFGSLKKLFFKPAAEKPAPVVTKPVPQNPSPIPVAPKPVEMAKRNGETMVFPTKILPPETTLSGKTEIAIPSEIILSQLPSGAIKISLAELRRIAPEISAPNSATPETLFSLSLSEIIPRLDKKNFTLRPAQKRLEASADIGDIFGTKGGSTPAPVSSSQTETKASGASSGIPFPQAAAVPSSSPASTPVSAAIPQALRTVSIQSSAFAGETLSVPLAEIMGAWPETVRAEIARASLTNATVSFSVDELEKTLKSGKAVFNWRQIASLLKPAPEKLEATNAEVLLELPLKIIVPRFFAQRKPASPQKKITIPENIPDVFKLPGATAPVVTAPPVEAKPEVSAKPTPTTPADLLKKIGTLDGIVGAVITGQDGLLLAAQVSAPLNGETMAAFIPQIFARVNQPVSELQKGNVGAFTIHLENSIWHLVKSGRFYVLTISRIGAALPIAQLNTIAAELAQSK